jgi:hypothetical protein
MTNRIACITTLFMLALLAHPAIADEKGQLGEKVVAALKSVQDGKCPEELMGPLLLDQCEQQLDRMHQHLSSLGAIGKAEYKGVDYLPNGVEVEVYKVKFAKGTMLWLAAAGPNGKFVVLWSQG